jgi:hypothetical protein
MRKAFSAREKARKVLRGQLEAINRTARGLRLDDFWIPRQKSDPAIIRVARMFLEQLESHKQKFLESRMPGDFIDKLKVAADDLERKMNDQTFSKAARLQAAVAIENTRMEALEALQRLDPVMLNLLEHDPVTLAVWQTARRVERYSRSGRGKEPALFPPPLAPEPPVETASA